MRQAWTSYVSSAFRNSFVFDYAYIAGDYSTWCNEAAREGLSKLGAETVVHPVAGLTVAAGQTFTLQWRRGQMRGRYPAYLMIAFDGPVRFEGTGFYALLPKAFAAFGISQFADKTRAIIPYYGHRMPHQGEVTVRPLQAGALHVKWAVVGHDLCNELRVRDGGGSATIRVEATGTPEIVVNPFARKPSKQRIYSPAGGRIIEIYDGRYRLVDEASHAEIAERAGKHPRFSPTGRYLAAIAEDGFEILDTVDGKTVYRGSLKSDLAWDNADSFAILGGTEWGILDVVAPSMSYPLILTAAGSCHACSATATTAVKVDLENNTAIINGGQYAGAISLTASSKNIPDRWSGNYETVDRHRQNVIALVRQSAVTAVSLPKRWELHGGLKFSHLSSEYHTTAPGEFKNDPFQLALMKFLVRPLTEPIHRAETEILSHAVKVAQWRGLPNTAKALAQRNLLKRLKEFGLPIPEEVIDENKAGFSRNVMQSRGFGQTRVNTADAPAKLPDPDAIVRRIEQEVPSARGVFVERTPSNLAFCRPLDGPDEQGKKYVNFCNDFQRVFRSGERSELFGLRISNAKEERAYLTILHSESSTQLSLSLG